MRTTADLANTAENTQALFLVQALLGNVMEGLRAVAIDCSSESVNLTFVLDRETPEYREEIEDIVFEFEALQPAGIAVAVNVIIEARPFGELPLNGRLVFLRKE